MGKNNKKSGMAVGILSLMMVLVILMLTLFGVLGVMTAHADLKLSRQNLAYIQSYYEADYEMAQQLAEINTLYRQDKEFESVERREVSRQIPLGEGQQLVMKLVFREDTQGYRIKQWQVVNDEEESMEEGLLFDQIDN